MTSDPPPVRAQQRVHRRRLEFGASLLVEALEGLLLWLNRGEVVVDESLDQASDEGGLDAGSGRVKRSASVRVSEGEAKRAPSRKRR